MKNSNGAFLLPSKINLKNNKFIKYFIYLFIILSIFSYLSVYAEGVINSGFIPGQIWYSKESLIEGDTVNIHTAVWNGEKESILVRVEFYDKNVILGDREVVVNTLELKDVYVPWKITSGDHVISAKIVSSVVTVSGKKEIVILDRNTTLNDKQFISVVVKNILGEQVTQTDALKNQIDKTTSEINSVIPEEISSTVSTGYNTIDNLRENTSVKIDSIKNETKKEIDSFKNVIKDTIQNADKKSGIEDATKKPITYVKLFLFSILSFIFGNKIIFYGFLIVILFYIFRLIYRKIRNR
jgi:hypothetical protein